MNKRLIVLALIALLCISQVEGWRIGRRRHHNNNNPEGSSSNSQANNNGNNNGDTQSNNNNNNGNAQNTHNNNNNNGNAQNTNNNNNNNNNNNGNAQNTNNNNNNNNNNGNTQSTNNNNNNNNNSNNNNGNSNTSTSSSSLSDVESQFLALHNDLRAKFGIAPLTWSASLASYSKSWSETMANNHAFHHGGTHGTGENISFGTTRVYTPADLFGFWSAEAKIFITGPNYPHVSTTGNALDVSHYTQILWSRTTEVGCGLAETATLTYLTCQYSPPGNILGQPVY